MVLWLFTIAVVGLGLNSAMVWFLAEISRHSSGGGQDPRSVSGISLELLGLRSSVFDRKLSAAMALLAEHARGRP